jgi:hypothetical protein
MFPWLPKHGGNRAAESQTHRTAIQDMPVIPMAINRKGHTARSFVNQCTMEQGADGVQFFW